MVPPPPTLQIEAMAILLTSGPPGLSEKQTGVSVLGWLEKKVGEQEIDELARQGRVG